MSKITSYGSGIVPPPPGALTNLEGDSGGIVSANSSGTIFIFGDEIVTSVDGFPGSNELIISAPGAANTFETDSGNATAAAYIINILGGTGITTFGSGNTVTIDSAPGPLTVPYVTVVHAQSPYTVLPTDYYMSVDESGGAVSILLPDAPDIGRIFVIKDKDGLAAATNITVTTVGGAVTIDGNAIFFINNAYESLSVIFGSAGYEIY